MREASTRASDFPFQPSHLHVPVVVQFYPWFNSYFPLFFFMLIYDNEYETKENKIERRIKLNFNIPTHQPNVSFYRN